MAKVLSLAEYCLSKEKAERLVKEVFKNAKLVRPQSGWKNAKCSLPGYSESKTFQELVDEVRQFGGLEKYKLSQDFLDPVFGGKLGITTDTTMGIGVSKGGYKKSIRKGPGGMLIPEQEVSKDILYHREKCCEFSEGTGYEKMLRYFRSYLTSAISFLDVFINCYIIFGRNRNLRISSFKKMESALPLEKKLEQWALTFCRGNFNQIKRTPAWDHFQKLRRERNRFIHSSEPYFHFELKEVAKHLNYCSSGVGELLLLMRKLEKRETTWCIEKVRNAPRVELKTKT